MLLIGYTIFVTLISINPIIIWLLLDFWSDYIIQYNYLLLMLLLQFIIIIKIIINYFIQIKLNYCLIIINSLNCIKILCVKVIGNKSEVLMNFWIILLFLLNIIQYCHFNFHAMYFIILQILKKNKILFSRCYAFLFLIYWICQNLPVLIIN